ncbi:hypothetical protein ACJJIQ_01485 [Microbulbifer sp. ANSA003]|uniref:hypothetical protein n=1 Tax=Microbulbifer sp. ANSA003 TaxID=3243360 RepID=UPI0040411717
MLGTEKNPKGPNLNKFRKVTKNISGSELSFFAPPPDDPFSSNDKWEAEPDELKLEDLEEFKVLSSSRLSGETQECQDIRSKRIYSNRWAFRGLPIIQGYCGHINCLIDINYIEDLPINESLFNKTILAQSAYRRFNFSTLQDLHSAKKDDLFDLTQEKWSSHLGPLNCQWVKQGNNDWLYFESQPLINTPLTINLFAPIDHKFFISFRFVVTRSASEVNCSYELEKRIEITSFLKFSTNIINTLNLNLSKKEAANKKKVETNLNKDSIICDRPILSITNQEIEHAKHVMYEWSKVEDKDTVIKKENSREIDDFIENRIKARPLSNSYPIGDPLYIHSKSSG